MKNTYLEAKSIINGKPFDEIVNLPKIDKRFSYGTLNGSEGEGLVDLNFKDILVTVRNNNGVATIVNYEQYDANGQFTDLVYTNESKTKKNTVKLNESQLKKIVTESVKRVLKEVDDFNAHGYKAINNYGGNEIQINNSGDAARLKFQNGEITDWLEIEFDDEGVAYITTPNGQQEKLSDYMRY